MKLRTLLYEKQGPVCTITMSRPEVLNAYNLQMVDELRQVWMASTVPLCEQLGLKAPAHWDEAEEKYVLEYPFPCEYDHEAKVWLTDEGEISWDQVFERWKGRGPMNEIYVESVQRSRSEVGGWLAAEVAA